MKALLFLIGLIAFGQSSVTTPVEWAFTLEHQEENIYKITASADLAEGWALYSQDNDGTGPVPTSFTFDNVTLKGDTKEHSELIAKYSDIFETEVKKFKNKAVFTQIVEVAPGDKVISGSVRYMCCDDLKCLPPTTVVFDLAL